MIKNKVMLFGYWENNLGDDLFLKVFIDQYPDTVIYLLSKKKYKNIYSSNNVKVISYDGLICRLINKMLRSFQIPELYYIFTSKIVDTFVCLGGSLFMESAGWKAQVINLQYSIKRAKNNFVIGSNFGPYHKNEFYEIYKNLFSKMDGICFRDKYSYNLFPDLSNVSFSSDVVLNMKPNTFENYKENTENYYVISIINTENREEICKYKNIYEKKIAEIANELIKNYNKVVLMSFCDNEGDKESALRIKSMVNDKENNIEVYSHKSVYESLKIIANCKGIIATRFHAMILAFVYNKPVFPIVYSEKMENAIKDYSFNNEYICIKDMKNICSNDVIKYLQVNPNITTNIFELAQKQFTDFDNSIKNLMYTHKC